MPTEISPGHWKARVYIRVTSGWRRDVTRFSPIKLNAQGSAVPDHTDQRALDAVLAAAAVRVAPAPGACVKPPLPCVHGHVGACGSGLVWIGLDRKGRHECWHHTMEIEVGDAEPSDNHGGDGAVGWQRAQEQGVATAPRCGEFSCRGGHSLLRVGMAPV
ncbi:hypothetical protein [Nocardia asteroides]|uniref:hypothetical protein n=1 Tax=Nocardia asteroides TaxID=1824 RepID=UPI0033F4EDEC